jgi:hypothetical protein
VEALAYPYGICNLFYQEQVEAYYSYAGVYPLLKGKHNYKNTDPYSLSCTNINDYEEFTKEVRKAINNKSWLVVCFHRIGNSTGRYFVSEENFRKVAETAYDYQNKGTLRVVGFSEGASYLGQGP